MSNFLTKALLKAHLVEEADDEPAPTKKGFVPKMENPPPPPPAQPSSYSPPTNNIAPAESSVSLQEAMTHFDGLLKDENERNHPGNDYYEFIITKETLKQEAPDLPAAPLYRTSFAGMKAMGLSKDKLLQTADEYMKVIENEITSFENQYKVQYSNQVDQKQMLIKQKTDEMNRLSEELKQLNQDVAASTGKLSTVRAAFIAAGEKQKQKIQQEKQNINQYIL